MMAAVLLYDIISIGVEIMHRQATSLLALALFASTSLTPSASTQGSTFFVDYPLPADIVATGRIAVGPDGNLWFTAADMNQGLLGRSTTSGTITTFPSSGTQTISEDVTAGPDGALWFTYFSQFGKGIGRMSVDGTVTDRFTGELPSENPEHITAGSDGNLWFTEQFGGKIGRITPTGVITEFVAGGGYDITNGPDGNLWYTIGTAIGRITPTGSVTLFALPNQENAFMIAAGPDGNLWYTKPDVDKIGRITTSGQITEFAARPRSGPFAITVGPDGNLWFTAVDMIGRITPSGQITEFALPATNTRPSDITAGPDGNLWFVTRGTISKLVLNPKHMSLPLVRR
jgi:streptogramin lyase